MEIVKILLMLIAVTIVPMVVGTVFWSVEERAIRPLFGWLAGQVLIWAGFQCICVPAVLMKKKLGEMGNLFFLYVGALIVLAVMAALLRGSKRKGGPQRTAKEEKKEAGHGKSGLCLALWAAFFLLFGIQLFLLCFLAFEDGDDSFYVAISAVNGKDNPMYLIHPYTGDFTGLDIRHALAPFPVWIAVLSMVFGFSGAEASHVAAPLMLVPMTYLVYYLIGRKLVGREEKKDWLLPLFLCFTALFFLFGGYSIYSTEKFLLTRSSQGKSVLANFVIPFLIYLAFSLTERYGQGKKADLRVWILIAATMVTGCLCSTLGSLLLCILLGALAFSASVVYRRWSLIAGAAVCMILPVVFIGLYVMM